MSSDFRDDLEGVRDLISRTNWQIKPGMYLGNRYHIGEILGQGGMGRVYLAIDTKENRQVVIKQVLLGGTEDNSDLIRRFRREYEFLKSINYSHLVKAYEFIEVQCTKWELCTVMVGEWKKTIK